MAPPVPMTLMVEVETGIAKPFPLPPPHPLNSAATPRRPSKSNTQNSLEMRRLARPVSDRVRARMPSVMPPGARGSDRNGVAELTRAGTLTVIVTVCAEEPGTTVAGVNVALAPVGRSLALSATAVVKGFKGISDAS